MPRGKRKEEAAKDDALSTLVTWVQDTEQATSDARRLSERDRDYYDNKQWTPKEEEALSKRGQPCITLNRVKPKVDSLLGLEQESRTDPKAFPRTPADEEGAHAATDSIRFVLDNNDFNKRRSEVFADIAIEGYGGSVIEVDSGLNIRVRRIPWDRIIYDHHSRERDFADARYMGVVVWLDLDQAVTRFGEDSRETFNAAIADFEDTRTYDDRPRTQWVDGKRRRVKFVELYYLKDDVWHTCVFTKSGFVRSPQPSPYLNDAGEPEPAIELMSCYVDRDNNRYGVVRQYIGPQDEINKRRSKALHLISVRQIHLERGAVDDINVVRKELAKPDGVVETNPGMEFEVLPTGDMAAAQFQLLQEAKQEIDAVGANASLQGKQGATSGRELLARQQGGLREVGPVFDALRLWQKNVYRKVWNRIRQYWTAERWVRVTDDENNIKFVGLNIPALQPDGSVAVMNNTAQMNVDIVLEDAPDTANIQQEQFQELVEMYKVNPQNAQNPKGIPFDLIVEASGVRNKGRLLEHLRGESEEQQQAQQPDPVQIAQMQALAEQIQQAQATTAAMVEKANQEQIKTAQMAEKAAAERLETEKLVAQVSQTWASVQKTLSDIENSNRQVEQQIRLAELSAVRALQQ